MNNQCPSCQKQAMDAVAKLVARPQVCKQCGTELRMNLIYTIVLSLLYFIVAVRILLTSGLTGTGIAYVAIATVVFIVACLFVPFEKKA